MMPHGTCSGAWPRSFASSRQSGKRSDAGTVKTAFLKQTGVSAVDRAGIHRATGVSVTLGRGWRLEKCTSSNGAAQA